LLSSPAVVRSQVIFIPVGELTSPSSRSAASEIVADARIYHGAAALSPREVAFFPTATRLRLGRLAPRLAPDHRKEVRIRALTCTPTATRTRDLLLRTQTRDAASCGLAWPCSCGHWLPVWLPGISLAELMSNGQDFVPTPKHDSGRRPHPAQLDRPPALGDAPSATPGMTWRRGRDESQPGPDQLRVLPSRVGCTSCSRWGCSRAWAGRPARRQACNVLTRLGEWSRPGFFIPPAPAPTGSTRRRCSPLSSDLPRPNHGAYQEDRGRDIPRGLCWPGDRAGWESQPALLVVC
jgi:hypothetical protein